MRSALLFAILVGLSGCKETAKAPAAPVHDAAAVPAIAPPPTIEVERWGGEILQPPEPPLAFELLLERSDPPKAQLAIPAQQLGATDLVDVSVTDRTMAFTLAMPGMTDAQKARFSVTLRADGTAMGKLDQNGGLLTVSMRRLAAGESVAAGPARPQTPAPPFPYDERPAQYASKDGTALAGTLTVPHGAGPYPAVILVTGTGAQDRDETLYGHKPFWVIADHLSRHGIAVLRVDDRGVGGSGGSTDQAGLDRKIEDVLAGVAWLATQPGIDPARVGVVGHSEGGVIAPEVAIATPTVAFVVLLAAPGVTGAALSAHQTELQLRADNYRADLLAARLAGAAHLVELSVAGADDAALRIAIGEHLDVMAAAAGVAVDATARAGAIEMQLPPLSAPAARAFLRSDPRPALRKVRVPVLGLWGSLDLLVDPEQNLPEIRAALADNPDVTLKVLPGLNHLFQPAKRGTISESATIETTVDPVVLDELTAWLRLR